MRYLVALFLITCGVGIVVAGEKDDSPGLGGIGVLLVLGTLGWVVRQVMSRRPRG